MDRVHEVILECIVIWMFSARKIIVSSGWYLIFLLMEEKKTAMMFHFVRNNEVVNVLKVGNSGFTEIMPVQSIIIVIATFRNSRLKFSSLTAAILITNGNNRE